MYDEASSLDVHHLVREFSVLDGGKVEKVYEWEDQEAFIIKIYNDGETYHLRLQLPGLIYLTERRFQAPKIPPGYARFLRNKLTASRIDRVEQHSFDRLIELGIDSHKHGEMTLIFEVFKPANIVLIDDENTIIHPYRQQSFKDRLIRSNETYEYPPERPDTPSLGRDDLAALLGGDDNVERQIATTFGLGGTYASEVTHRTEIPPDKPVDKLTDDEKKAVARMTTTLFEEQNPVIIDGEAHPVELRHKGEPDQRFDTFVDALDTLHDYDQVIRHDTSDKSKKQKYETIINAQQNQIEQFEEAITSNQNKANYIYEHYQDFATLIYTLREKKQEGEDAFQDALDSISNVVDYDPATNEVTLQFDDD